MCHGMEQGNTINESINEPNLQFANQKSDNIRRYTTESKLPTWCSFIAAFRCGRRVKYEFLYDYGFYQGSPIFL